MNFTHLHTHSHYSLLDGLATIDKLIKRAQEEGMKALALTDHGTMYGAIEFYQKAKKAGIKPIIGVEIYVAPNGRLNKRAKIDEQRFHLVLLAKNQTGYKNLLKLTSIAHLEGFYYKPRIDEEVLEKYHDDLIALSACLQGEVSHYLRIDETKKARSRALYYKKLFGPDNYYLELQSHPSIKEQELVNQKMIKLARELDLPLVATNDIHYLKKEDDEAHDVLLCLQTKRKKEDVDRMCMLGEDFSFYSTRQMSVAFTHCPEAVSNTQKIVKACNLDIELGKVTLPFFKVPQNQTAEEYLEDLCQQGLVKRFGGRQDVPEISERLNYELDIIRKTGFASYFLIVQDFVNWAKEQGIVVGPGRGSAAGSLVSYLLNITNIDPLRYELLFERFLNPARISLPDIDLDFADTRRDEVIRYVEAKYGQDHVAQIITFGTMAARAVVRDVGRVQNLPYTYCDQLAKLIPPFASLDESLKIIPELRDLYKKDPPAKKLIDTAKKLEGVARHASTHACGVLITPEPLDHYVPLQYASSGDETIVSQYSLHPIEDLGLLKMDFLGLKNLTILENTIKIIKKVHGQIINIDEIPLNDKRTFSLLQKGETTGVFQLESSGMKRYLKQLRPTKLEDIIAMVALYRPGPMELIPDFIAGKHGRRATTYLHPKLKPILEKTYGVAVYQEQVLQIARDLAGFSLGEADVLRKAVGKKIPKLLKEQKRKFIEGSINNGVDKRTAERVFNFIEPFAGYGFNRAHAACYALIAYQTAYLKANFLTEFMAALLTSDQDDTERIAILVEECHNRGIEVLPPDINESFSTFTVVASSLQENKPRIRFGLLAIKNVGANLVKAIIHEREENGAYENLEDLLARVNSKDLNKKSLESLVKCGALDNFGERGAMLGNIERLLNFIKSSQKEANDGQASLFGMMADMTTLPALTLEEMAPADDRQKLTWEKELLGLYVSEHPFNEFQPYLKELITPCRTLSNFVNKNVRIAGIIDQIKKVTTRGGEAMLFVRIEDDSASIEALIFPKLFQTNPEIWQEGKFFLLTGRVSDKEGELKILTEEAQVLNLEALQNGQVKIAAINTGLGRTRKFMEQAKLDGQKQAVPQIVAIKFNDWQDEATAGALKAVLAAHPGNYQVHLLIPNNGSIRRVSVDYKINYSADIKEVIEKITGAGSATLG